MCYVAVGFTTDGEWNLLCTKAYFTSVQMLSTSLVI